MSKKNPLNHPTNEPAFFWEIYLDALKEVPKNRTALFFAGIATLTGTAIPGLFQEGAPLSTYAEAFNGLISSQPLFAAIFLLSLVFSVFSTGALTLTLSGKKIRQASKDSFSALAKLIGIDVSFFFVALLGLLFFLTPNFLTPENSPILSRWLLAFGIMVYIPVLVILILTREYASLHALLSKTGFKTSIRLGYGLVAKKFKESLVFGAIFVLFVFFLSLAMETFTYIVGFLPLESTAGTATLVAVSLLLQAFSLAIGKSVWLSFFILINTEKKSAKDTETSQDEEKVIQKEVPEVG